MRPHLSNWNDKVINIQERTKEVEPLAYLFPQYTMIEYESSLDNGPSVPLVFLLVLDTCMIEEELGFLKSTLAQAIELLPEKSLVGLITFWTYVQALDKCRSLMYLRGQKG